MATIGLTEAEFWKLKAHAEEAGRLRCEAAMTPQAAAATEAVRQLSKTLAPLGEKYGFDARARMTLDEPTLSLILDATPAPGDGPADTPSA